MAIATDATSNGSASATTVTVSHTCTGDDGILFVGCWIQNSTDQMTSVTYNGVAMTQIGKINNAGTDSTYLYYLIAPATGANDIVMTKSGTDLGYVIGSSYTGASQTGQPDASTTNTGATVTSLTTSVTTVADNTWTVLMMKASDSTNSAGTGTTLRIDGPGNDQTGIYDSNGAITPAGSTSLQTTAGTNRSWAHIMASFSPATAAGPANLKTLDTIATANIKTINGIAIANVKTINTIA